MKIFPLRPMSNYDRFINMMEFMKHAKINRYPAANKYGMEVEVDVKHCAKEDFWNSLFKKYRPAIKEIVAKMKGNHGKKSAIN